MLDLLDGMTLGGQRLVRRLHGRDGREVFSAVDLTDERPTVVKVASLDHPDDVEHLAHEFALLRAAAGVGVVPVLGHAVSLLQGMAWLTLAEQGPSLACVLSATSDQRLSVRVSLAAVHAAATSLGELHSRGWRHGDVKPGNLLCNADGSATLSDLELASRLSDASADQGDESLRSELLRRGTPAFMAPELWRESPVALAATDVWALGVTLYLCLMGDYPFGHKGDWAVAEAVDRGTLPRLNELPAPLAELLHRLLAHDPIARPMDGREAAMLVDAAAKRLDIDLDLAREEFAALVIAVPQEDLSPAKPGTMLNAPRRATEVGPDETPPTPDGPPRPPRVGDGTRLRRQADGIDSGYTDTNPSQIRRDFLDISSKLDISSRIAVPPRPAAPMKPPSTMRAPMPKQTAAPNSAVGSNSTGAPNSTGATLTRRAAARWYRRMNPNSNFPLSVVISGKQIRIAGGSGLGIALGQREIALDPADPLLNIEPHFPGCLISPPQADLHVSEETTICRFWITPLVTGDLKEACVSIRYRGQIVETLATPATVVDRMLTRVLAAAGLAAPIVSKILSLAGWGFDSLLRRSLPACADLIARLGPTRFGACLASILLAGAVVHFYITRPLLAGEPEPVLLPQAT